MAGVARKRRFRRHGNAGEMVSDLTADEQLLAALMLDEAGGLAFVKIASRGLRTRQAELGITRLSDVSEEYRNQLLALAIEDAAVSLLPDLNPERLQTFICLARMAWEMDVKATVAVPSPDAS